MTDTESRLLAAGDALANSSEAAAIVTGDILDNMRREINRDFAIRAWRALAREVRKEKGDDA